jgi:hypothetical protein
METYGPNGVSPEFGVCFIAVCLLVGLISTAFMVLVYCKIFSKAGYHWAMGLIALVPLGNLIMLLVLAFGQWPIHRERQALKHTPMAPPPEGQPHKSFRGN